MSGAFLPPRLAGGDPGSGPSPLNLEAAAGPRINANLREFRTPNKIYETLINADERGCKVESFEKTLFLFWAKEVVPYLCFDFSVHLRKFAANAVSVLMSGAVSV